MTFIFTKRFTFTKNDMKTLNNYSLGLIISQIITFALVIFLFYMIFRLVKYSNPRIKKANKTIN